VKKIRYGIERLTKEKAALWKLKHIGKEYGLEEAKKQIESKKEKMIEQCR